MERVGKLRFADPFDATAFSGPLVNEAGVEKVLRYIELGKNSGARLICGGERESAGNLGRGYFVQPTVFADAIVVHQIDQKRLKFPNVVTILRQVY